MNRAARTSRRGGAYVLVLVVCSIAAVVVVSGLAMQQAASERRGRTQSLASSRLLAQSGLEAILQVIADDSNWRTNMGESFTNTHSLGAGMVTIDVTDEQDGDLTDDDLDTYTVTSLGRIDDARAVLRVDVSTPPRTYRGRVLKRDPVGYWPFDEGHWTTTATALVGATNGGYSHNGVPNQATGYDGARAPWMAQLNSLAFVPHHAELLLDEGTVMCHLYLDREVSPDQTVFAKDIDGDNGNGSIRVFFKKREIHLRMENRWTTVQLKLKKLDTKRWYHFAATFGTDGLNAYIDGKLEGGDPNFKTGLGTAAGGSGNTHNLTVGLWYNGSSFVEPLYGSVRDLIFLDHALTPAQLEALLKDPTPDDFRIDQSSWTWVVN